jgi:serine/threonine protein kinase
MGRLGPYRIHKVLGAGAMGVVFEAEDPHLRRLVGLKVMKPSLAAFPEYHRRFLREARLAAALDHENVVPVYQVGEDRGVPFLAMKLLQGETLEERLERVGGRLAAAEVLRIGREVAEGLAAAHARGLVHRDIKPANVWLEGEPGASATGGRVKILDFGLARGTGDDAGFTQAGSVIGTPYYMAPEQANAEEVDGRCDLFGLGAVLYRACTGAMPFDGKDTLSVLRALATETPRPPHRVVHSVPRAFSDLIMRLLEKDRADRPQSAREVVEALEAIERGEQAAPVPTETADPPSASGAAASGVRRKGPKKERPAGRRRKRRPAGRDWGRRVLVVSLVLLGVGLLVLALGLIRHARARRAAWDAAGPVPAVCARRAEAPAVLPGERVPQPPRGQVPGKNIDCSPSRPAL